MTRVSRKFWMVLLFALGAVLARAPGTMTQAQAREVADASVTQTANVSSDGVDQGHKEWTWVNGANLTNQQGTYATQGTPDAGNVPGARNGSLSWTDAAGNFWLFGGQGFDSSGAAGLLNDLWKYSGGQWTWIGGSNVVNQPATYGTEGTPAAANVPGGRFGAIHWTDAARNVWLFGGSTADSDLSDLWEYSAGQWAWMGGSSALNRAGTYGAQGTPSASNLPGGRDDAASWTDAAGHLWIFGGHGYDAVGTTAGLLNDLWRYSGGQWMWMGGSNVANQKGTYGTRGTAAAGNVPGARELSVAWTDSAGNFWLFGGLGYDAAGNYGDLDDLWKYNGHQWTWMGGSNLVNQKGIYGTQGTPATGNLPGARHSAVGWTDAAGNSWLFGGLGYDSAGATIGFLSDLWKYSAGEWAWMGGSNVAEQKGTYGTQGTADAGNVPGARCADATWTDAAGNLWLFGGGGSDSSGTVGFLNDLWKYAP